MLVLSRKKQEAIQIGEDIEIKILSIEGDQVKIGIEAPSNIAIHRKEVIQAIEQENNEAANISISLSSLAKELNNLG